MWLDQTKTWYNRHADMFEDRAMALDTSALIDTFIAQLTGKNVLDLGCGCGRDLAYLAQHDLNVIGQDPAQALVDKARARANVPVYCQSLEEGLIKTDMNGILCLAVFVHIPLKEWSKGLVTIYQGLAKNGVALIPVKDGDTIETTDSLGRVLTTISAQDLQSLLKELNVSYRIDTTRAKSTQGDQSWHNVWLFS